MSSRVLRHNAKIKIKLVSSGYPVTSNYSIVGTGGTDWTVGTNDFGTLSSKGVTLEASFAITNLVNFSARKGDLKKLDEYVWWDTFGLDHPLSWSRRQDSWVTTRIDKDWESGSDILYSASTNLHPYGFPLIGADSYIPLFGIIAKGGTEKNPAYIYYKIRIQSQSTWKKGNALAETYKYIME